MSAITILVIAIVLLGAWFLYPRIYFAKTRKSPFHAEHLRRVKELLERWNAQIRIDCASLGVLFKELAPERIHFTETERDSGLELSEEEVEKRERRVKEHNTERQRVLVNGVIALSSLLLWPVLVVLNALVLAQVLEVILPVGAVVYELPMFGEFNPIALVFAIVLALAGAMFAMGLHAPSTTIRVVNLILMSMLIAFEAIGGYWRGLIMESYVEFTSTSIGPLTGTTPAVSALIGTIAPSAEMTASYLIFKGLLIPINFQLFVLPRLVTLWVINGIKYQYYAPFLKEQFLNPQEPEAKIEPTILDEVTEIEIEADKILDETDKLCESVNLLRADTNELLKLVDNFINHYQHKMVDGEVQEIEFTPSVYVKCFQDQIRKLLESDAWKEISYLKYFEYKQDNYEHFTLDMLRKKHIQLKAAKDQLENYREKINDQFKPLAEEAYNTACGQLDRNRLYSTLVITPDAQGQATWAHIQERKTSILTKLSQMRNAEDRSRIGIREMLVRLDNLACSPLLSDLDPISKAENHSKIMLASTRLGYEGSSLQEFGNLSNLFGSSNGNAGDKESGSIESKLNECSHKLEGIENCFNEIDEKICEVRDKYFRMKCRDAESKEACASCPKCEGYKYDVKFIKVQSFHEFDKCIEKINHLIEFLQDELHVLNAYIRDKEIIIIKHQSFLDRVIIFFLSILKLFGYKPVTKRNLI